MVDMATILREQIYAGVAWAVECVRPTTVEIPGAALETMDRHPIGQWFADLIERSAGRPRLLTAAPPPSELPNMPAGAAISPPRRTMSPPREQPQADLSPIAGSSAGRAALEQMEKGR